MTDLALQVKRDADLRTLPGVLQYVEFSDAATVLADLGRSNWYPGTRKGQPWYAVRNLIAASGSLPAGASFPVRDPEFIVAAGLPYMRFSGGDASDGNALIAAYLFSGPQVRHAFLRYVLWIEPDVSNATDGVKLPGAAGEYEDTIFNPPEDVPAGSSVQTFSWRMENGPPFVSSSDGQPHPPLCVRDYLYDGASGGGFGNIKEYGGAFPTGVPITIEQELDVDAQHGRVWVDGVLIGERPVVTDVDIEMLFLNVYHGGTGFATAPIHYRLAAACIATSYIGVPVELRTAAVAPVPATGGSIVTGGATVTASAAQPTPSDVVASLQNALSLAQAVAAGAPPAQAIASFAASAASITAGQAVTVTWATVNATAVRLNGVTVASSGSQAFSPTVTTPYVLQADGSAPTVSSGVDVTVTQPASGGVPTWRQGLPVRQWTQIPNTAFTGLGVPSQNIDAWCGLAAVDGLNLASWINAAGGGHVDSSDNGVYGIDWRKDVPAWAVLCAPSALADRQPDTAYSIDLKPTSCHTYWSLVWSAARGRVLRPFSSALWSGNLPDTGSQPEMDGFDPVSGKWDAPGTYPNCPIAREQLLVAIDPISGDILVGERADPNTVYRWAQSSNQWAQQRVSGTFGYAGYAGGVVDRIRNRLVRGGLTNNGEFLSQIPTLDLATGTATIINSGITDGPAGPRTITHDYDRDVFYLTDSASVYTLNGSLQQGVKLGSLPAGAANGVLGRMAYFSDIDAVMFCPSGSSNCWALPTV